MTLPMDHEEKMLNGSNRVMPNFSHEHAQQEPKAAAVRALLEELPATAREAIGVQSADKYQKIKSKLWKVDVSRFLTVAYMATEAYAGPSKPAPSEPPRAAASSATAAGGAASVGAAAAPAKKAT